MLQIQTQGDWRDMGRQIGRTFAPHWEALFHHFVPWLKTEPVRYRTVIAELRRVLADHCPELLEETLGMAEEIGVDEPFMLGFRYFNELRERMAAGCSALFLATSDRGPLLAYTCDIEPDLSSKIQLLRVSRPRHGPATAVVNYLGLTGGAGFNEYGLGVACTGAVAQSDTLPVVSTDSVLSGLPFAAIAHLLLTRCRSAAEAGTLATGHQVSGKGGNLIVADPAGASALIEMAPGHPPLQTPRAPERRWQACTTFFPSPQLGVGGGPEHLAGAYSRYGRIAHRVEGGGLDWTVASVKELLTDIAQPGLVSPKKHCVFRTAYAFVVELTHRRMHLTMGHPATTPWTEVEL